MPGQERRFLGLRPATFLTGSWVGWVVLAGLFPGREFGEVRGMKEGEGEGMGERLEV